LLYPSKEIEGEQGKLIFVESIHQVDFVVMLFCSCC